MSEDDQLLPGSPSGEQRFELAPNTGVEMFVDIAEEFMERILDFEPGDYLITDESSLLDFLGLDEDADTGLAALEQKIREEYEVEVSDLPNGNLLAIFMRIHRRKYGPPA